MQALEKEFSPNRERIHVFDFIENVLLFIVVTFAWGVCFLANNSFVKGLIQTTLFSFFLSCFFEFSQLLVISRTFALQDIVANTLGIFLAVPLLLQFGKKVSMRSLGGRSQTELLFLLYLFNLAVYSFFPFDFTMHPVEIARSFKQGKLLLVPFSDFEITDNSFEYLLKNISLYVPAGLFGGMLRKPAIAIACVFIIEFIQIFLLSRFTTIGDIICGTIGTFIGLYICKTMWVHESDDS